MCTIWSPERQSDEVSTSTMFERQFELRGASTTHTCHRPPTGYGLMIPSQFASLSPREGPEPKLAENETTHLLSPPSAQ